MPERRRNPEPTVANRSDSRVRNRHILRFLPVTRYFFGHNFWRADLAGAQEWNMQRNDVILGVLNFFGYQGFRSAWLVASPGHGKMGKTHANKPAIAGFSN
jgi:hypothetical protein